METALYFGKQLVLFVHARSLEGLSFACLVFTLVSFLHISILSC